MVNTDYLLIGRVNGKSSSRRQDVFADAQVTIDAIQRWEAEGYNTFWVYGPAEGVAVRPLVGKWARRDDPDTRLDVLYALREAR